MVYTYIYCRTKCLNEVGSTLNRTFKYFIIQKQLVTPYDNGVWFTNEYCDKCYQTCFSSQLSWNGHVLCYIITIHMVRGWYRIRCVRLFRRYVFAYNYIMTVEYSSRNRTVGYSADRSSFLFQWIRSKSYGIKMRLENNRASRRIRPEFRGEITKRYYERFSRRPMYNWFFRTAPAP